MAKVTVHVTREVDAVFLRVSAGVRYWEDATVNGVEDEGGKLIPFREGDVWTPTIALDTGRIVNWPDGIEADIHYKVCDDGKYELVEINGEVIKELNGYVPKVLCPGGDGFGDYIIMKVDGTGKIENFKPILKEFEEHVE